MSDFLAKEFGSAGIYASHRGLEILSQIGAGVEGIVYATDNQTALKAHRHRAAYYRELEVYVLLAEHGVEQISGFQVPRLVGSDNRLMVIEMEHVVPPFVVDFAQASLVPIIRTEEEYLEWDARGNDMFGPRKWDVVKSVLSGFRRCKIYLADIHPRNIDFGDDNDEAL